MMSRRHGRAGIALATICFLLPFAVYLATLAPTLSWRNEGRDGGDLMSAICTLGIPHPPGYPLYVLLGRLFALLPLGDVGYRINLMSAFFAASTVVTVYVAARALIRSQMSFPQASSSVMVAHSLRRARWAEEGRTPPPAAWVILAAFTGALALAFSPTFWSQATIAEVYALGAFLSGLVVCLITRLPASQEIASAFHLLALGLTGGLCLTHHLTTAIWMGACGLWLLLFRPVWLRRPRSLVHLAGGLLLGLSVYLYLPLRSAAHPAANWGAPHDLHGFLWVVTAEPYRRLAFTVPWRAMLERIPVMVSLLARQFGWVGVGVGLAGVWAVAEADRRFLAFSLIAFLGSAAYAVSYNTVDSFVYLIPTYQVFSLWVAWGTYSILRRAASWESGRRWPLFPVAAGLLLVVFLSSLPLHYTTLDASSDRVAHDFATAIFAGAAPRAILLVDGDEHTFALWYYRDCVQARPDVAVLNRALLSFEWYQAESRRLYPALSWPESLRPAEPVVALITANQGRRPIYLTESDERLMSRFSFTRVGSLYRLDTQS
jgi:hypothetical protein